MADFTKEQLDDAVKKAVTEANAARDKAEKGLKDNFEKVLAEKKAAAEAAKVEAVKAAEAEAAKARKDGDFEAMDASWKKKVANLEEQNKIKSDEQSSIINRLTAGATVASLSSELALKGSESIFGQIIKDRVGVEIRDGKAITVIKDKDGKPSAATLDDFKKELMGDAALKPLLSGSNSSGGGAAGATGGAGNKTMKRIDYEAMTPQAQAGVDFTSGLTLTE